ncbi:universal stress protein [Amycolatopsis decaplanina]|uniref:UspA domain-containing protein n=1 Tax=Amycolatopsis decaplanina DSM 44594 TaxID=1284240 RepID=M2Z3D3_9PSEU|nr:universal stress protein [Amycolatopsis decaplanina]EME55084.1 UspA domain-containing protein [Amycolatopsis decaplanina DSM 44594]
MTGTDIDPANAKPVLVGVDGSRAALAAVEWAAEEAVRRQVGLDVLWVSGPGLERVIPFGKRCLHEASMAASRVASGLPRRCVAEPGDAAETLIQRSAASALVTVGASGHGQAFLGGVVRAVAARAAAPVVIVHAGAPASGKIVAGVDDSPSGDAALAFAAECADLRDRPLMPVRVWYDHEAEAGAARLLDARVRATADAWPKIEIRPRLVRNRDRAAGLLGEGDDAGLIVIGSHGRRLRSRPILGITSHEVLERARCPVAVIPATYPSP